MAEPCPICGEFLKSAVQERGDKLYFECPRCGAFSLTGSLRTVIQGEISKYKHGAAQLSHALFRMQRSPGVWAELNTYTVKQILESTELPLPAQQLDNLLLWLADSQIHAGAYVEANVRMWAAIGAADLANAGFIVAEAVKRGLIEGAVKYLQGSNHQHCVIDPMQLTLAGWQRSEELRRGRSASRMAFMAMRFGDPQLDTFYREHLQPAVAERVNEFETPGVMRLASNWA